MASRKQSYETQGKPGFSGGKNTEAKTKSQKETYKQKNYKSSPSLSTSISEKPLFHYTASSKSEANSHKDDDKNFSKWKNSPNAQSYHKNTQHVRNPPVDNIKLGHQNNPNFPEIVSPLFMSMSAQCNPYNTMPASVQSQHKPKFHQPQNNIKQQPGAKPKNYKDSRHNSPFKSDNKNFSNKQNQFVEPPKNMKETHLKQIQSQDRRESNHGKVLYYKNNCMAEQQCSNVKLDVSSKSFQPHTSYEDYNSKVNSFKNSTPVIKYRKKMSNSRNDKSKQCVNEKPFGKTKRRRRKKYEAVMKTKESETANVLPLLTFQSCVEQEKTFDLIHFSDDDDDMYSLSQNSTDYVTDLIDFSDVNSIPASHTVGNVSHSTALLDMIQLTEDSTNVSTLSDLEYDSSETSDESDLTSEYSETSILDTETKMDLLNPTITIEEAFVAVFWDIENCSLPSNKSAVDFVSYVRRMFYEGRSEVTFTAACDVSKLISTSLVRELDEASVTLVHVSSQNKNAADKKIMALLQRFQTQYRKSNSAIVLISSDSDFSQILNDMRYQHHIFVNLICRSNTRSSLTTAADHFVYFDSLLGQLPDRDSENDVQHVLIVTNLPQMKFQQIKSCLEEKLKSFNCRIKYENMSTLKVIFKDHSVCMKAMVSLEGFYLKGNLLAITYEKEMFGAKNIFPKKEKKEKKNKSLLESVKKVDSPIDLLTESKVTKESNVEKSVTLCVYVNQFIGDEEYWKNTFENLWGMKDFSIVWDKTFEGCFLISFKSMKKAQKAKKILQKNQVNNPLAPKFLKLIKQDENLSNLNVSDMCDVKEQMKKKIYDHLQIIEKKKQKILKQHENNMNELKHQGSSAISGTAEVVIEKLKECKEQMETFINFSNIIINAIKLLNCDSEDVDTKLTELLADFTHECNSISSALPIYAKKDEILRKLREHQVIIIRAETGSGKSTQLIQYVWKDRKSFQGGKIICTQPRKIAAISLARHVSSQIGSSVGGVVGYQVGMVNKTSADTRIVYVTDFTMLKILISENLDGVSCLIVDEAHERTIYTDILLGMIKQYLPKYPHLNVIITSATIDTSIFRDYFGLTDDAVLCIPGRIFPVEDIWLNSDVTPDGDYFTKTIDKAFDILTEEPGDVLSFLTTPFETEKAVESFSKRLIGSNNEKKVKMYCLHGKMNSEDQQKVFEKTTKGIRKVIFATNCAETSITIPGIKYVIDCGLVKESQYDSIRNMNVLSVGFVSKSSAEQRRGRAGRTQVGKCYRLYSKRNYNSMASNTCPEILRINLGQALLKLLKLGVNNPLQFDFIQSPPKELLFSAMDQLLFLKAIDENLALTELGQNMAALPLEPRLSNLVFQGFENDIGYDTLVTAALVTMSHAIFFRNSENKEEADSRKRRFCESESDFISYLTVYKEWAEVPKNSKSQWCVSNCINAKSMRIVHELISEIVLILQKELNFKFKLKFNCEFPYDTLLRLIFFSFSENLSIFSGHPRCGYKCLNVSDQLLIHPSSSLSAFGQSTPDFAVYDTILKTTQTYIINVCPVTKTMILDAIHKYNLKVNLDALERLRGVERCISPVGERIIFSCFIGKKSIKRRELQRKIKELTKSDVIEVDIDVPKGCIKIFGFDLDIAKIDSFISPILKEAQQHLLNEKKEVSLLDNGALTGILSAGGIIADVVLPGEFRDLKVTLKNQEIDPVIEKLSLCGPITEIREWKNYYKVTFETPASAKIALGTYNNEDGFSLYQIHKYSPINERDYLYKVFMSFLRRPCSGVAFVSVEPKVNSVLLSSLLYDGSGAQMTISKKSGDIRITGLPLHTEKKKLETMISEVLPDYVKITKCVVVRKKPYESTKEEMDLIKQNLIELFTEFTFKENVTVFLKKPVSKDFCWNATVYFKNSLDGETAVNVLRTRKMISNFLGGFILKPQLQTYLCCKSQIFSVVKEEIEEALQFFKKDQVAGNSLNINAVPKEPDIVQVKIDSNNIRDLTDARRCIQKILNGDDVKFVDNSNKAKLFSASGKEWINKLSAEFEDCFILQNDYSKTLSIFGKETSCNIIKMRINGYLCSLEENDYKELNLKTSSGRGGVLKTLLKEYGYDLQKLKEDCEAADIQINKYKQLLIIQGHSSSISKCESIVENIKQKLETDCFDVKGEICPVCYDEVSEDKHRLQCCGHAYCTECFLHLLQNCDVIPLKCELELCEELIVLTDIFWAINGRKPLERVLFDKFLHSFVRSRNDISFCPSPDCSMVFRMTQEKMDVYNCIACGNNICTKCGELYHSGFSCSFHKSFTSDVALQAWMKEDPNNHKLCPSCSSPIEKASGCNHMTCWKCKTHMCWLCLQMFPTGKEVYDHQNTCPMNHPLIHPLI